LVCGRDTSLAGIVKFLKEKYPDKTLYFITKMILEKQGRWKNYKDITKLYTRV